MSDVLAGQRLRIDPTAACRIRFSGRDVERVAVAAINSQGVVTALEQNGPGEWSLASLSRHGEQFEIVAYIIDDRQGGFVNAAYPATVWVGPDAYQFPAPAGQLAAVILAEIYVKDGTWRLKVSSEGFTFGIDAYARARNLRSDAIPYRSRPSPGRDDYPQDRHRPSPPSSGAVLGSGSGVIVGHDLVVTNAHVIADGSSFQLGRTRNLLTPLAVDPLHDLALLQGPVSGAPLPLRLNSPLWLGEGVMASGFPLMDVLGADLKVTTGNVSGLTGSVGDVSRFQFTAPIGSGSSGGAVIDEFGNLVGVTAASLAHENMRERGSISENVNFGVRAALVYELIAIAGMPLPPIAANTSATNRRDVVNRLRDSVVSLIVMA